MQKLSRLLLHQRNDRAGTSHNFAFDTLTKVYRDAVYAPQSRYRGNPMYPEWGSASDPTNHVGGLGVLSSAAAELREQDLQAEAVRGGHHSSGSSSGKTHTTHVDESHHQSHDHENEHGHSDSSAAGGGIEGMSALERLRASHIRSSSVKQREAARSRMRHSGLQVEILGIYRQMLRETMRMWDPDTRVNLQVYIREEFDKSVDIPRKHITKIEWQLNYGKRKLEDLQAMSSRSKFSVKR